MLHHVRLVAPRRGEPFVADRAISVLVVFMQIVDVLDRLSGSIELPRFAQLTGVASSFAGVFDQFRCGIGDVGMGEESDDLKGKS